MLDQPSYYAIIPASVRYAKIPPNAKLLFGEITVLTTREGFCWATNQYFADLYGVSKKTISKWVSILQKNGFLDVEITTKEDGTPIRNIRIDIRKNMGGYPEKDGGGYPEKDGGGYPEKDGYNNTSINNTSINNTSINNIIRVEKKNNEDSEEDFLPIDGGEIETKAEIVYGEDFETKEEKQKSSGARRKVSTDLINTSGRPKSKQEVINKNRSDLINFFRKVVGVDKFKDFSEWAEAQRMEKLIQKIGRDDFLRRMYDVLGDPFKSKNCNKLAYLRKEIESYIHTPIVAKQQKTPQYGGLYRKPGFDDN